MNPQMYALYLDQYYPAEKLTRLIAQHQPRYHPCDDASEQEDTFRRSERVHGSASALRRQQLDHSGNLRLCGHAD